MQDQLPNTILYASAEAWRIEALVRGDLIETGDGLGADFAQTANGALFRCDPGDVAPGDFIVFLGGEHGLRLFCERDSMIDLGFVVEASIDPVPPLPCDLHSAAQTDQ